MIITNKTNVDLEILCSKIKPGKQSEYTEFGFNTLDVHSDIGSVVITTEYCRRSFRNFGKLFAKEGKNKDDHGLKEIFIYQKD